MITIRLFQGYLAAPFTETAVKRSKGEKTIGELTQYPLGKLT